MNGSVSDLVPQPPPRENRRRVMKQHESAPRLRVDPDLLEEYGSSISGGSSISPPNNSDRRISRSKSINSPVHSNDSNDENRFEQNRIKVVPKRPSGLRRQQSMPVELSELVSHEDHHHQLSPTNHSARPPSNSLKKKNSFYKCVSPKSASPPYQILRTRSVSITGLENTPTQHNWVDENNNGGNNQQEQRLKRLSSFKKRSSSIDSGIGSDEDVEVVYMLGMEDNDDNLGIDSRIESNKYSGLNTNKTRRYMSHRRSNSQRLPVAHIRQGSFQIERDASTLNNWYNNEQQQQQPIIRGSSPPNPLIRTRRTPMRRRNTEVLPTISSDKVVSSEKASDDQSQFLQQPPHLIEQQQQQQQQQTKELYKVGSFCGRMTEAISPKHLRTGSAKSKRAFRYEGLIGDEETNKSMIRCQSEYMRPRSDSNNWDFRKFSPTNSPEPSPRQNSSSNCETSSNSSNSSPELSPRRGNNGKPELRRLNTKRTEIEEKLTDSRDSFINDLVVVNTTNTGSVSSGASSSPTNASKTKTTTSCPPEKKTNGRVKSPRSGKNVVQNTTIRWSRGKLLGKGSFGEVFVALDCDSGKQFAVKRITGGGNDQAKKIQGEINVMRDLEHENIVQYIGSQTDPETNTLEIFLEYVTGGSLARLIKEHGKLGTGLVRKFARHITSGVEYLHGKDIIHRDIKGGNVLITDCGIAKLADFGCSKQLEILSTQDRDSTLQNIRGSIPWMSPEMIRQTNVHMPTDIWSLGATILEMATGKYPWPDLKDHLNALFVIGNTKTPPPMPDYLEEPLRDFLLQCFVIDPAHRATATELLRHPFLE